jgi:hypothetical protein
LYFSWLGYPKPRDMPIAIANPDQQPNGGVILSLPLPAPPVEKGQAIPQRRNRKKWFTASKAR